MEELERYVCNFGLERKTKNMNDFRDDLYWSENKKVMIFSEKNRKLEEGRKKVNRAVKGSNTTGRGSVRRTADKFKTSSNEKNNLEMKESKER